MSYSNTMFTNEKKLRVLIQEVVGDEEVSIDSSVIKQLQNLADDFIENATKFSAMLAHNRGSEHLEVKDLLYYLEKNWDIKVPGFDESSFPSKPNVKPDKNHKKRVQLSKRILASKRVAKSSLNSKSGTANGSASSSSIKRAKTNP